MRYLLYARPPGAGYPEVTEYPDVRMAQDAMRSYPPGTAFRVVAEPVTREGGS